MMRATMPALLTLVSMLTFASCRKNDDCAERLVKRISVGDSEAKAEAILNGCGYTWSFDKKSSTIYGLKREKKTGLVESGWKVEIKMSEDRKVTSITVAKAYTGP